MYINASNYKQKNATEYLIKKCIPLGSYVGTYLSRYYAEINLAVPNRTKLIDYFNHFSF